MALTNIINTLSLIKNKSVFIFDFDGVIADSVEVKTEAFAEIYKEFGDDIMKKVIQHHRNNGGMSRFEKFKLYHSKYLNIDLIPEEVDKLSGIFSNLVVDKVVQSNEIAGVKKFIKDIKSAGNKLFVNSATPDREIREIVSRRGLDKYFSQVYGSPSSKKENIQKILANCKDPLDKVVFFGDAVADYNAALDAKVDFIGVGENLSQFLSETEKKEYFVCDFTYLTKR